MEPYKAFFFFNEQINDSYTTPQSCAPVWGQNSSASSTQTADEAPEAQKPLCPPPARLGWGDHRSAMAETFGGSDGTGRIFPFLQGEGRRRCDPRSPLPPPPTPRGCAVPRTRPVSSRRRSSALPGFFGRILCRWGSASPTCGTSEPASPARCHGEESFFPMGEENLKKHGEHPTPHPPRPTDSRSRRGGSPLRGGGAGPGTHQLIVERRGEAVDPSRVPDHPVEEIGHAEEAAAGLPGAAHQHPQQRQRRGGTCGEPGGVGGRGASGGMAPGRPRTPPLRSPPPRSALTCSPRRPGQGHVAAEPAARRGAAGIGRRRSCPRSPLYMAGGDVRRREDGDEGGISRS